MNKFKIVILVLIFSFIVEVILVLYYSGGLKAFSGPSAFLKVFPSSSNPLITFQVLPVQGKITRVSGKVLSVQNTKGVKGELGLSDNVSIIPPPKDNQIVLNKDVILTLEDKGAGVFIVSSILYIPDIKLPVSTTSATITATPGARNK